jgi:hypothetical protein
MLRFVSEWSCCVRLMRGLPSRLFPFVYFVRPSYRVSVMCCVTPLVMCCVVPFCNVPRASDTSIVVLGFVTHSTIREELQSCLIMYIYCVRGKENLRFDFLIPINLFPLRSNRLRRRRALRSSDIDFEGVASYSYNVQFRQLLRAVSAGRKNAHRTGTGQEPPVYCPRCEKASDRTPEDRRRSSRAQRVVDS